MTASEARPGFGLAGVRGRYFTNTNYMFALEFWTFNKYLLNYMSLKYMDQLNEKSDVAS